VSLFNCSITTEVFEGWIEHDLLPKLKEKSVLIMDNATFHKGKSLKKLIQEAGLSLKKLIQEAGHYLVWLPKYSPDLNLIEKM